MLEGIDLAAMSKHPERRYARLGTVALPRRDCNSPRSSLSVMLMHCAASVTNFVASYA
ncbi:MAG: hypothetical protein VB137_09320 [Burkholderia sp.]